MEQREIKFRFWTPDKRMIEDHDGWVADIGINEAIGASIGYGYKIMQYTGLKDKNGEEIYEGDILRIHNTEEDDGMGENFKYRKVYFKEGGFVVEWNFGDYDITTIGWAIDRWTENYITCEVIGNIYQNPELIGG